MQGLLYTIGVGFCVARSDLMGSAKASKSGMSDEYRLPRFFMSYFQMLYHKLWRVGLYIYNNVYEH